MNTVDESNKTDSTNPKLKKYYTYLKNNGADVPSSYESFENTLNNPENSEKYYNYLKENNFDTPSNYESFSNTFGLKKKGTSEPTSQNPKSDSPSQEENGSQGSQSNNVDNNQSVSSGFAGFEDSKPQLPKFLQKEKKEPLVYDANARKEKENKEEEASEKFSNDLKNQVADIDLANAKKELDPNIDLQKEREKFREKVTITQEEIDSKIKDEEEGTVWDSVKSFGKKATNFINKAATWGAAPTVFDETEKKPYQDQIKEVKAEALKKGKKLSESEIKAKAKDLFIDQKKADLYTDKANDYLDGIDENVRESLSIITEKEVENLKFENKRTIKSLQTSKKTLEDNAEIMKSLIEKIKWFKSDNGEEKSIEEYEETLNQLETLRKETKDLVKVHEANYNNFISKDEDLQNAEQEFDYLKRTYDWVGFKNAFLTTAEIGGGFADAINMGYAGVEALVTDKTMAEASQDELIETKETRERLKRSRENLRKPIESVESVGGYFDYTSDLVANQLPILAITSTGTGGLVALGLSSSGQKYSEISDEIADGKSYNAAQILGTSIGFGAAEAIFELPTLSILKKGSRVFKAGLKGGPIFKESAEKIFKDYSKDYTKELLAEQGTNVIQNGLDIYVLGKEGSVWDNAIDVLKDSATLTALMQGSPVIAGRGLKAITNKKTQNDIDKTSLQIKDITKALSNENITDSEKEILKGELNELTKKGDNLLKKAVEDVVKLPTETHQELVSLDKEKNKLQGQLKDLTSNGRENSKAAQIVSEKIKNINSKKEEILNTPSEEIVEQKPKEVDAKSEETTQEETKSEVEDATPISEVKQENVEPVKTDESTEIIDNNSTEEVSEVDNNNQTEEVNENNNESEDVQYSKDLDNINSITENYAKKWWNPSIYEKLNDSEKKTYIKESRKNVENIEGDVNQKWWENQEKANLNESVKKDETTQETNTPTDGNVQPGIEQGNTKQQGQDVSETTNTKPSEGKTKQYKLSESKKASAYNVSFKNGNLEITDSNGKTPSKPTQRKVRDKYAEDFDFTEGEVAKPMDGVTNPEEYIANESNNPSEIAIQLNATNTKSYIENNIDYKTKIIADAIGGRVEKKSYINYGDKNNIGFSMAKSYFAKKGEGRSLDNIAQELSEDYGIEITEQDIVDHMETYTGGKNDVYKEFKDNNIVPLQRKFTELTGLPANDKYIEIAVNQTIKKEQLNEQLEKDYLSQLTDSEVQDIINEIENYEKERGQAETNEGNESRTSSRNTKESKGKSRVREGVDKENGGKKEKVNKKPFSSRFKKAFNLNDKQNKASLKVIDAIAQTIADRTGRTKEDVLSTISLKKGDSKTFDKLKKGGKALFQFVGKKARLKQDVKDNLKRAKDLETQGKSNSQIFLETGWERGLDGKWRTEINSSKATFKSEYGGKLSDVLDYPTLFESYPDAAKIEIVYSETIEGEGAYYPKLNKIYVNPNRTDAELIPTIIHEVQHWIQEKEGFAKGGNEETARKQLESVINGTKDSTIKSLFSGLANAFKTKSPVSKSNISKAENILNKDDFELYQSIAGEVEARNAEKRLELTEDQKKSTPFSETEDVAREEQVVLFQEDQGAMIEEDGKFTIYALTNPNVSTPLHEMAHVYEHYLTSEEKSNIMDWAGHDTWTTETSEVFARGFEKYLSEGKAPNKSLQKAFDNFKNWLTDIYNGITNSDIDIELSPKAIEIYDNMLGGKKEVSKNKIQTQSSKNKLKPIEKSAFTKLTKRLGRAFPKVKIVTDNNAMKKALNNSKTTLQAMFVGGKANKNITSLNDTQLGENLVVAKEMEANGKTPEQIRTATGWFFNTKDKKWRYEVSDKNSNFTPKVKKLIKDKTNKTLKLSEVLDSDNLYELYPELKDVDIKIEYGNKSTKSVGNKTTDNKGRTQITIRPDKVGGYVSGGDYTSLRGVVLHEVQHVVQSIEGFATGSKISKSYPVLLEKHKNQIKEKLGKEVKFDDDYDTVMEALKIIESINGKSIKDLAKETYLSNAGEVEARSTQFQENLSEKDLAKLIPYDKELKSLGIKLDDTLIENNNNQKLQTPNGEIYGFVDGDTVYIDDTKLNANTPIHEFGHIWINTLKTANKGLYAKGLELIKNSPYFKNVLNNPSYDNLTNSQKLEEALATAIGDKGEAFVKDLDKTKWTKFLEKVKDFLSEKFFINQRKNIDKLTLDQFLDGSLRDILGGKEVVTKAETSSEIFERVNRSQEKAKKALDEKRSVKKKAKDTLRKAIKLFTDRQFLPKKLFAGSGLEYVSDLMINSKGANGKANRNFEKYYDEIFKGLSENNRDALDKIIQLRRFIAIDQNRKDKGLEPVDHPDYIDAKDSEIALQVWKDKLGDKKYNDLVNRADKYFKAFNNILTDMYNSGLISKEQFDSMNGLDYQPRLFVQHITDFEGNVSLSEGRNQQKETSGLNKDQIKALKEGSEGSLILNAEWLLASTIGARYKAIAMNNVNRTFMSSEYNKVVQSVKDLKAKAKLTGKEKRLLKYQEELIDKVKPNPIVGFTKDGKPKFATASIKGYEKAYYYEDGVKKQFFIEKELHEQWFDNVEGLLGSKAKNVLGVVSGASIVKAIATGNNPAFALVNTPRDFAFLVGFSDQYSNNVIKGMFQVTKDTFKSLSEIYKHNMGSKSILADYIEYGGDMSFLSEQGRIKKNSAISKFFNKIINRKVKDSAASIFDNITLRKISNYSEIMFRLSLYQRTMKNSLKEMGYKSLADVKDVLDSDGEVVKTSQQVIDEIKTRAVSEARSFLDFNQGGSITKDLESVIPYINTAVQGTRVAAEKFKKNPLGVTSRLSQASALSSAFIAGSSFMLIGSNMDDDDERSPWEFYLDAIEGISSYQSSQYMNIVTGKVDENGDYEVIKIAKTQQITPLLTLTDNITNNLIRRYAGREEKDMDLIYEDVVWSFKTNIVPIDVGNPQGVLTASPMSKAILSYTTGYDFFRDQPLSYDIGDVEIGAEGLDSRSIESFYKNIAIEQGISAPRMKAAIESYLTTPKTNPFIGLLYSGAGIAYGGEDVDNAAKKLGEDFYKSFKGRVFSKTSDFNKQMNQNRKFKDEINKKALEEDIKKKELKIYVNEFMDGKIDLDGLKDRMKDRTAKETEYVINKVVDLRKFKNIDRNIIDLKYTQDADLRAFKIFKYYGDLRNISKENKEITRQMLKVGGILSEDVMKAYGKLLNAEKVKLK